jgi:hypothetical protein
MGTSAGWKYMLLAYSYENKIAIPITDKLYKFTGGLSRLWKTGFSKNVVKYDFNSLYPAITLTWGIFPELDIIGVFRALLEYILSERERCKGIKKQAGKKVQSLREDNADESEIRKWVIEENKYDRLQLPWKIFGNGFFGSYGAANIFNWGSVPHAEQITCTGRQSLRLMVKWMMNRGFEGIICDTDGVNFDYTKVDMNYEYTEKGLNRNTKEGVVRKGLDAYTAEFNDRFMRGKMGLGLDEIVPSSVYFSRKNYADLLDNGKVKLVGNSIKSKKMPKFIESFIDKNLRLLLQENGYQFLQNYNDYVRKISNYQIPLRSIASIGKIKISLKEYKEGLKQKNKAGNDKARQAWYEIAIRENMDVHPGDTIYYVNTGTKKGEGDVVKTPIYQLDSEGKPLKKDRVDKEGNIVYGKGKGKPRYIKKNKVDKKGNIVYDKNGNPRQIKEYTRDENGDIIYDKTPLQDKIISDYEPHLNCVRIDEKILETDIEYYGNEDIFGNNPIRYNIPKYIEQFNKRITGLLTCFHPNIRNNILITDPNNRNYYTKEEAQLVSGMPKKPTDQDTLEELFTMEDKEIKFWLSVPEVLEKLPNKVPPFLDTPELMGVMGDWETIKKEYFERQEVLKQEGIKDEVDLFYQILFSEGEKRKKYYLESDTTTISEKLVEVFELKDGFLYSRKYGVKFASLAELFGDSDKYEIEKIDEDIIENTLTKTIKEKELFPF